MKEGTYTKLKSGAWGARGWGQPPKDGEPLLITTKGGLEKAETCETCFHTGIDPEKGAYWIASIIPKQPKPR